jgi:hypothetical protein
MTTYTAFDGHRRIASGPLPRVAEQCKVLLDARPGAQPIIYDDTTGAPRDLDYRGSVDDMLARLDDVPAPEPTRRGPGRPRLGVVAREVTLLPRHWDWLAAQPGGASATLRRLVETARREGGAESHKREAREAAYRFLSAIAGNLPGYEEALRALFAGDAARFESIMADWPEDVRAYALRLAEAGDA